MKRYIFTAFVLPILSLLLFTSSYAANTLSPYVGFKVGYNHLMTGKDISYSERLFATVHYESDANSTPSLGFVAGITIPLTKRFAIRPAFEYTHIAQTAIELKGPNTYVPYAIFVSRVKANALFANLYVDFYLNRNIYIYTGAGVGLSTLNAQMVAPTTFKDAKTNNLSWHAGVGAGYYITKNVFLDLGVRYMDLGSTKEIDMGSTFLPATFSKIDFTNVEVLLTLAYKF